MQRKKSRFLLFIFSFIPGAGEMYLGFMKMGVSLMAVFAGTAAVVGFTGLGFLSAIPIVIYAYGFFHANNLGTMDDAAFREERDRFLFGLDDMDSIGQIRMRLSGKYKKAMAGTLIFFGVIMLWQAVFNLLCDIFGWDNTYLRTVYFFMRDDLPRFIVGFAVIWIGMMMIRGKKVEYEPEESGVHIEKAEIVDVVPAPAGETKEGGFDGDEACK